MLHTKCPTTLPHQPTRKKALKPQTSRGHQQARQEPSGRVLLRDPPRYHAARNQEEKFEKPGQCKATLGLLAPLVCTWDFIRKLRRKAADSVRRDSVSGFRTRAAFRAPARGPAPSPRGGRREHRPLALLCSPALSVSGRTQRHSLMWSGTRRHRRW